MTEKLLGPKAVANHLDVPLATLYRWRTTGDGPPAAKIGRHLRYRLSDVEKWIDAQLPRDGK